MHIMGLQGLGLYLQLIGGGLDAGLEPELDAELDAGLDAGLAHIVNTAPAQLEPALPNIPNNHCN